MKVMAWSVGLLLAAAWGGCAEIDSSQVPGSDGDADTDSDTDADTDSDTDTDTDSDADGDADSDADGDTDSDTDTEACGTGDARCTDNKVEHCIAGTWRQWDDCPAMGKICAVSLGEPTCITSTDGDADTDSDSDADTDADGDADTDADTDADGDADGDADTDADGDADTDADGDADTDADTDADGDTDTDADTDTDTDADTDTDVDTSQFTVTSVMPDEVGWVDDQLNDLGIQGAWYTFGCDGSVLSPEQGAEFVNTGEMCFTGTAPQVTDVNEDGTLDWGDIWGAGMGVDLCANAEDDDPAGKKFPLSTCPFASGLDTAIVGFQIDFSGGVNADELRITFNETDAGPNAYVIVKPPATLPATVTALFSQAVYSIKPADKPEGTVPADVRAVQFAVPSNSKAAVDWDFCVTDFKILTD